MSSFKKRNWETMYGENLDIEGLKSIFSPPQKFRVSEHRYPAGETVSGSMRACKCFLISGSCVYQYQSHCSVTLDAGDYVELPEGNYQLTVQSQNDLDIIFVWELPRL